MMTVISATEAIEPELTADQQAAFKRFAALRVGAIFMEQGMGKSRVAVNLANDRADRIDAVLWVAPFSVLAAVEAEVTRWGCEVPVRFVGYETLSQSDRTYLEVLDWCQDHSFLVIADESTFIKNAWAKRNKRMMEIRKHADYALALNGTPLTRDVWDLKRQMDFLSPRIISMGDREFRSTYFSRCEIVEHGKDPRVWFETYVPNVAHLKSLIEPYIFEARLELGLPETTVVNEHAASDEATQAYEQARDDFFVAWEAGDETAALYKMIGGLTRVAANDPAKCASVADTVTGKHALVFCQFREEQRQIAEHLRGECLIINGDTCVEERERVFERSKTEHVPLLLTYGTGSFGLNLQHFNECHFASMSFNYGRQEQAKSRIRRLGQTSPIAYTEHRSEFGIDTMIAQNIGKKTWLADLVRHAIDPREVL